MLLRRRNKAEQEYVRVERTVGQRVREGTHRSHRGQWRRCRQESA